MSKNFSTVHDLASYILDRGQDYPSLCFSIRSLINLQRIQNQEEDNYALIVIDKLSVGRGLVIISDKDKCSPLVFKKVCKVVKYYKSEEGRKFHYHTTLVAYRIHEKDILNEEVLLEPAFTNGIDYVENYVIVEQRWRLKEAKNKLDSEYEDVLNKPYPPKKDYSKNIASFVIGPEERYTDYYRKLFSLYYKEATKEQRKVLKTLFNNKSTDISEKAFDAGCYVQHGYLNFTSFSVQKIVGLVE